MVKLRGEAGLFAGDFVIGTASATPSILAMVEEMLGVSDKLIPETALIRRGARKPHVDVAGRIGPEIENVHGDELAREFSGDQLLVHVVTLRKHRDVAGGAVTYFIDLSKEKAKELVGIVA